MVFDNNISMKKIICIALFGLAVNGAKAQKATTDSAIAGKMLIIKDSRLDELAKKETAFNELLALSAAKSAKGYRLMLLNTNDRVLAMKVRTQLLQRYPDQKVYMSFQPPYIKLKFGNFLTRPDADNYKKEILKNKLVTGSIYIIPETIEVKPEKNKDTSNSN